MSIVTLVSGGLDSTVVAALTRDEGITQLPLFVDYGQRNKERELAACRANMQALGLPMPVVAKLPGYGALLPSGLTDSTKDVVSDAFLPCRNLMLLLLGAAYAFQHEAHGVAIGLLDDAFSRFPDQTRMFVGRAEGLLSEALGTPIRVIAPLMGCSKADIVRIASGLGIAGAYSCHVGGEQACGVCIACQEYRGLEGY